MTFFYSRGRVKTTVKWTQPTTEKARAYFHHVAENSDILERYKVYIVGAFLYEPANTWDVDLNLTGDYEPEQLEDDLDYLLDIGLNKFALLVDAKWVSKMFPPFTYEDLFVEHNVKPVHAIHTYNIHKTVGGRLQVLDKNYRIAPYVMSDNLQLVKYFYVPKRKMLDLLAKGQALKQQQNVLDFLKEETNEN